MSSSSQNQQNTAVGGGVGLEKTAADASSQVDSQHSAISSAGAIGRQFNADGAIGQIGQNIGGPFDKDGVVGSQFDAGHEGIAGKVERMVGGPKK